jgi:hypothetical protein
MTARSNDAKEGDGVPRVWPRRCRAGARTVMALIAAAVLGGCVPIGVRIQNMFSALLG